MSPDTIIPPVSGAAPACDLAALLAPLAIMPPIGHGQADGRLTAPSVRTDPAMLAEGD
jgi:hypothetical protein